MCVYCTRLKEALDGGFRHSVEYVWKSRWRRSDWAQVWELLQELSTGGEGGESNSLYADSSNYRRYLMWNETVDSSQKIKTNL